MRFSFNSYREQKIALNNKVDAFRNWRCGLWFVQFRKFGNNCSFVHCRKKNNVEAEHNDQRLRVKQRTGPRRVQLWTVTDVFVEWMALIIVTLEALVHISQLSFVESDASRDGCSPLLWFRGQLNKNNKICGSRNRTAKLNGHTRTLLKKAPTEFGNIFIGVCGLTALLFWPINVCVNKVVAPVVNWKWKQVTEPFYWLNSLYSPLELQRSSIHCRTVRPCTWLRCQERLFFFFIWYRCCSWFGICTLLCRLLRRLLPCRWRRTEHRSADLAAPAPTPSSWDSALCLVHLKCINHFDYITVLQALWIHKLTGMQPPGLNGEHVLCLFLLTGRVMHVY